MVWWDEDSCAHTCNCYPCPEKADATVPELPVYSSRLGGQTEVLDPTAKRLAHRFAPRDRIAGS